MDIKKTTLFTVLFICSCTAFTQPTDKYTGSLLWKISGNGLTKLSYIFGTHHAANSDFLDSIQGFWKSINKTEQVVGEILLSDMEQMQTKMLQVTFLPKGVSYKDSLSEEEYLELDEGLKKLFGVGMEQFGIFHPAALSSLYTIQMHQKYFPEASAESNEAIDIVLQKQALEKEKSVIGLETIDEQIDILFFSEPLKEQMKQLVIMVSMEDSIKDATLLLMDYYKKGDLAGMYDLYFSMYKEQTSKDPSSEVLFDALTTNRNNNWLKKIPQIMQEKPSFIAVGALHLAGKEGLLYQLNEMGYTIEAVK